MESINETLRFPVILLKVSQLQDDKWVILNSILGLLLGVGK